MRVSEADKKRFNELYLTLKSYAAVARETGFSPGTVKRYIVPDYVPADAREYIRFEGDLPEFETFESIFKIEDWAPLCELSEEEEKKLENCGVNLMGNEDRFFYLDESPYYTSKYVIRMNHSKFPFPHGADGSYNLIAARLLGLSYASYLRFARDVLGAEIVGKRHRFPLLISSNLMPSIN